MRTILVACFVAMSALVTLPNHARAEDSHSSETPRDTSGWRYSGWTTRLGTSVGYSDIAKQRWSTLGAQLGVGYRFGPFAIEGEYETNQLLYYTGLDNDLRGSMKRLGGSARFYFLRFGALGGGNSHFLLFVDAAVGTQRGTLEGRAFARNDYGTGMGLLLDHRVNRADIGVRRIGWHLGWRMTGTPRASEAMARIVCQGSPCPMTPSEPESDVDVGLALGSSLSLSW